MDYTTKLGSGPGRAHVNYQRPAHDDAPDGVRDPVCGMTVAPAVAAATADHRGETFYFCAPACKRAFDADPRRYARLSLAESIRRRLQRGS